MLPEPLVTVNQYGAPELASEDLEKLKAAGVDAYLGGDYHRHHGPVELQVPASQARKALEVLGLDPLEEEAAISPVERSCPDCGSRETSEVPPYAWRVILASLAIFGICLIFGIGTVGVVVVLIGWLVGLWLSKRSGHQRCHRCKREWKPA